MMNSRRVIWAEHVARILSESLKERKSFKDLGVAWENNIRMALKRNKMGRCRVDSSGSGWGSLTSYCQHDNETLGSAKDEEYLD
jgi:hypothetical protein